MCIFGERRHASFSFELWQEDHGFRARRKRQRFLFGTTSSEPPALPERSGAAGRFREAWATGHEEFNHEGWTATGRSVDRAVRSFFVR